MTADDINEKLHRIFYKYKIPRKKFQRVSLRSFAPYYSIQADLMQMNQLEYHNNGINYLLVIVDVLSRYIWCKPLKKKSGPLVYQAFKEIIDSWPTIPAIITTDKGKI